MTKLDTEAVARLTELTKSKDLDGLVAISPEAFTHVSGFPVPSQEILRWRHAAVGLTSQGEAAILCVDMEETTVRNLLPDEEIYVWAEFSQSAMAVLAEMLKDLGLDQGRIGMELSYLPAADFSELVELLPGAEWIAIDSYLRRIRQVKTDRELRLIGDLAHITDKAIYDGFQSVGVGSTELDLAGAVLSSLYRHGVDSHKILIVASGERSQYPNVGPTDRALQRGDVIRVEVFGVRSGYHAGVCRTAVVKSASSEISDIWDVLVRCRQAILDGLAPGVRAKDIHADYMSIFSELEHEPISFAGHGIGLELHEEPYLTAFSSAAVEENMVFGVEPLVFIRDRFGMQIKDIASVDRAGSTLLSDVSPMRPLLEVG